MSDLDKPVIEAAVDGMQAEIGDDLDWTLDGWWRVARSAIRAADAARAEAVKAAVDQFEVAALAHHIAHRTDDHPNREQAKRHYIAACRDLFARLGIEDQ